MANLVLGVFSYKDKAAQAIADLEDRKYNPKDISIVMKSKEEAQELAEDTGAGDVLGDTAAGATTGALVGGIAGLLASTVIPGLGAFFIGGPIAAYFGLGGAAASTVSGAVTGAAAGGLIGALTSAFGLTDEEAKVYEESINMGGVLVAVPTRSGDEEEVQDILEANGADNIKVVERVEETTGRRRSSSREEFGPAFASDVNKSRRERKR